MTNMTNMTNFKDIKDNAKKLTESIEKLFMDYMKYFLDTEEEREINSESLNIHLPYETLRDCLNALGYEEDEESLDLNGWQNDYWQTFNNDEKDPETLYISGTMSDGTFAISNFLYIHQINKTYKSTTNWKFTGASPPTTHPTQKKGDSTRVHFTL